MTLQSQTAARVRTNNLSQTKPIRDRWGRKTALASAVLVYAAACGGLAAQTVGTFKTVAEADGMRSSAAPAHPEFDRLLQNLPAEQAHELRSLLAKQPAPPAAAGMNTGHDASALPADKNGRRGYIVVLKGASVATSLRGARDAVATQAPLVARGLGGPGDRLDVQSADSQRLVALQRNQQSQVVSQGAALLGRALPVERSYHYAINGFRARLSESEAAKLRSLDGVAKVLLPTTKYIATDTSVPYINAPDLWNAPDPFGTRGEGSIVGMLDTGANLASPSFAATEYESNGVWSMPSYHFVNPLGAGNYRGWCNPGYAVQDKCNDKLIGTYDEVYSVMAADPADFPPPIPEPPGVNDQNGHGSHTASTSAGNSRTAKYLGANFKVTGVAPHANLELFQVCTADGACYEDTTLDAVEHAILDGVNVLNYSIGPKFGDGANSPWDDATALAFLSAADAGIFVAAAAGNDGPGPSTVANTAPWVTTVAASTSPRDHIGNTLSVTDAGAADLQGLAFGWSVGPSHDYPWGGLKLKVSPQFGSGKDCGPYPADFFKGTVALVDMAYNANAIAGSNCTGQFKDNVLNAAAAGAVAVVSTDYQGHYNLDLGTPNVPAFLMAQADAVKLAAFANARADGLADMRVDVGTNFMGRPDQIAYFSSRGPTLSNETLKPDIAAPGWNILAAFAGAPSALGVESGTSMATPHIAGSAALLHSAHPQWSPAEIKSALMLTAKKDGIVLMNDDASPGGSRPAAPTDAGAGRVQVDLAAKSGLVMHETGLNYLRADPAAGGDPTQLNVPSLYSDHCFPQCTFKRRFKNALATPQDWSVAIEVPGASATASPNSFTVPPGQSVEVTFRVDNWAKKVPGLTAGAVALTPADRGLQTLRLPVAVGVPPPIGQAPSVFNIKVKAGTRTQVSLDLKNAGAGADLTWSYHFTGEGLGYFPIDNQTYVDGTTTPPLVSSEFEQGGSTYVAQRFTVPPLPSTPVSPQNFPTLGFEPYVVAVYGTLEGPNSWAAQTFYEPVTAFYADDNGQPGAEVLSCGLAGLPYGLDGGTPAWRQGFAAVAPEFFFPLGVSNCLSKDKLPQFTSLLGTPGKQLWLSTYLRYKGARGDNQDEHFTQFGSAADFGAPLAVAAADHKWQPAGPVSDASGKPIKSLAFGIMGWALCNGEPWLIRDAESGSVPAGQTGAVPMTVDATQLAPGQYGAFVCIATNASNMIVGKGGIGTLHVPVQLTVE